MMFWYLVYDAWKLVAIPSVWWDFLHIQLSVVFFLRAFFSFALLRALLQDKRELVKNR